MSFNFDANAGQSESQSSVDLKRRLAAAMLQQGMQSSPIQSPWQGVARLSEALMGGLQVRRQAQQEQDANSQVMSAITGQPYTPPAQSPGFLSSLFGSNKIPASDAQGQVAAASPAVGHASDMSGLDSNHVYSGFMDTVKGGVTNPYGLAAIAATGKAESGYDPKNAGGSWNDGANNAGGIMSWNGPRLANLQKFAGGGNGTPQQQGQFFLEENPALIAALNKAGSVEEAQHLMNNAWAFKGYNQPGNPNAANRLATAQAFLPRFAGQGGSASDQVASLNPSAGMGQAQQPYRDPMVTTAYQQPAPASPAAQAIQQQITPEQIARGNADAQIPLTGQQAGGPNALPFTPTADPQRDAAIPVGQNGQMAIPAGPLGPEHAYQPDPTQTASIGPQLAPPMATPTNIQSQPISNPMPLDRSGVGMGGAAPGPGAFPTAPGNGPARLAAALQGAQQGPQGAPPQQQLAQAMQGQGGAQGSSPLAGNPRAQALMQAMMNPYASPQARQMAGAMLQQQMAPQFDFVTRPDGSIVAVNKLNPSQSQQVQGPMKTDSIVEGPTDPQTGMPTKLLWNPIDGVKGRFNPDGSITPAGQQAQAGQPQGGSHFLTDDYKNYQNAVSGGYKEDFPTYQSDLRKSGAQSVTIAGETEESKALGTARAANIVDYMKAGPEARDKLQALNIISDAFNAGNGNISTGPGAEMILQGKQALQNLGVNMDGVAPTETVKKMGAYLAAAAAKSLAARPTQFDFKTFLQNNPGLDISVPGNKMLVNIMQQQSQHEMDLSRLAQSYKGSSADWNDVVSRYDQEHPIISPFTGKPLSPTEKMFPGGDQGAPPPPDAGAAQMGRPRASDGKGNFIEFDGQNWVPAK
jgi:hypothetical protein